MNSFTRLKKTALLATLVSVTLLSSCVVVPAHRYYGGSEVAIVPPPVGFVWYDGYWGHDRYGRHWTDGRWGPRR